MPPSLPSIGLPNLPSLLGGRGASSTLMDLRGQMRSELFRNVSRGVLPQPGSGAAGAHFPPGTPFAAGTFPGNSHAGLARGPTVQPGPAAQPGPGGTGALPQHAAGPSAGSGRPPAGAISQGPVGQAVSTVAATAGQAATAVSTTVQSLLGQINPARLQAPAQAQGNMQHRQAATPAHQMGAYIPGMRAAAGQAVPAGGVQGQASPNLVAGGHPASGQVPGVHTPPNPGRAGPMQAAPGAPHAALVARADGAMPAPPSPQPFAGAVSTALPGVQAPVALQPPLAARADGAVAAERTTLLPTANVLANPSAAQTSAPVPVATTPAIPALPSNPQAAHVATNPLAQQAVPASQTGAEARGNTVLSGGDRGAQRVDGPLPHGHTVEAGQRRVVALRGLGAAMIAAWGRPGDSESAIRRQADYVFQWMYWALTITAFCCLLMLLVATLPMISIPMNGLPGRMPLGAVAVLAGIGLCSGLTAWVLARRQR